MGKKNGRGRRMQPISLLAVPPSQLIGKALMIAFIRFSALSLVPGGNSLASRSLSKCARIRFATEPLLNETPTAPSALSTRRES